MSGEEKKNLINKGMTELLRLISTLLAAGIIALIASNFTAKSSEQSKEFEEFKTEQVEKTKSLDERVKKMEFFIERQTVFNENVKDMLKELRDEKSKSISKSIP